jgi:endoglucanase
MMPRPPRLLKAALLLLAAFAVSGGVEAAVSANVRLNSVGFLPAQVKRASVIAPAGNFNVLRNADNSTAYSGTLSGAAVNADTAESLRTADFSAMTEAGSFYLDVPGTGRSATFDVGPDVYNDAFWATVMGFYSHRCGTAINYSFNGQTYSHPACHLNDAYQDNIGGGHTIRDGKRGWHDAGDYGKYTINGAFASGMLLQSWEWHSSVLSQWSFPIPEGGGAIPDYLDEVKWNLDWLLKMQAPNGSVYHKLTSANFAAFVQPNADGSDTQYVRASSAATADFCAVMSMAARIYQPYDSAFAAQCLAAAGSAWAWLAANPGELLVGDANQMGTGKYEESGSPGVDDPDHRVWAAAEYWESTGNAAALADFESRMAADPDKVSTFWDWGEHAFGKRGPKNHGIFTYLLSARAGRNATRVADLRADLLAEANAMVATRNAHGYGRPLGTEYHWGSNGTVGRQVMLLDCANQISPSNAYVDTAVDALGYLFGRNMYNRSFLTGVGYNPPQNPHDRQSSSDGIPGAVPGHLVGGPGGHDETAGDYADDPNDYWVNEIAINWDAGMVGALAWFVTVPPPATPTPTPTPQPCYSATASRRVNVGGPLLSTGGNSWSADQAYAAGGWGYTGGAVSTNGNAIAGTTDDGLYNTGRYGMSQYQFTVANGSYKVELHFAETYFNGPGARVMSVSLEGQPAISSLDIYATVGGSTALVLTAGATVSDGILTVGFSASADQAELRAIAIYPATACPSSPTPTFGATRTPTPTPSFSASPTRTAVPSSPTPSPSATFTRSPSPSATPTGTAVISATSTVTLTPTRTPLLSATSTVTGTATATATATLTATPTGMALSSATSTATRTAAATATSTLTGTAFISFTSTVTGTPLATGTATLTRTPVSSFTSTATGTPVVTITSTVTGSPLATFTLTATRTLLATGTPTATGTPVVTITSTVTGSPPVTMTSTATRTPLATGTPTATGTPVVTSTSTMTGTPVVTSTSTMTGTPIVTSTSTMTGTPIVTSTSTATGTALATGTVTVTGTSVVTITSTATAAPILTATSTVTGSPSPTATSTATASPTVTPSGTASATGTASASLTATPNNAFSATVTPTPSVTATFTESIPPPANGDGEALVKRVVAVPQPQSGPGFIFAVELDGGAADQLTLKVYSRAYINVATVTLQGNFVPGWNQPLRFELPGLVNGIYFVRAQASANGKPFKASRPEKFAVLK